MAKYQEWITEEGLTLIEGWARNGSTDEQIANNMGISRDTLNEWKKKYSDISDALKKGKEVVDIQVESALYKSAIGYEYTEETYEGNKLVKSVKKHKAPDTTACIFWLKNRCPDRWRDKVENHVGVSFEDDGFIEALKGSVGNLWDDEPVRATEEEKVK